jgi:tetratricopeptide (TPR) repeat protein
MRIVVMGVLICGVVFLSLQRNSVWNTEVSLWRDVVNKSPLNTRAWINLTSACGNAGDMVCAMEATERALQLYPEPGAFLNLARIMETIGKVEDALSLYENALLKAEKDALTEEDRKAIKRLAFMGKGNVYFNMNKLEDAELSYRKAVEVDPEFSDAWNNLGYVLMRLKRCHEAEDAIKRALRLNPDDKIARENLELLKECR